MAESIFIKKLIVHILDNNVNLPVLSDCEHSQDDDIRQFIENHIIKILDDDCIKNAVFTEESEIKQLCNELTENTDEFIQPSVKIAQSLYDIMQKNPDIPSCDLVCALADIDGIEHLCILKMNYHTSYIHYIISGSSRNMNSIIKQKTALPNESQKIDECAIINLTDMSLKVIDKKYDINGEKKSYFSDMFLKCSCSMSDREKLQVFKKATKSFAKKYLNEDIAKTATIKKAVAESISESDSINLKFVAQKAFSRNPDLQDMYVEHIETSGLDVKSFNVKPELCEKAFKRHKIKTDTGIEINLPIDCYRNQEMLEFITNADGTISILIKNIGKITDVG